MQVDNMDDHDRIIARSLTAEDIEVQPDEGKLAELLLLVANELAGDRFAGATKVNKVLFFAEFAHVRQTGRPITGVPYQKLVNGPAPRRLVPVRDRLIASGDAVLETEAVLGRTQHRLRALRAADVSRFSDTELAAVRDAIAALYGRTGSEVSRLSHEEAGWRMVGDREIIPYATAYLPQTQGEITPKIRARAEEIAEEYAQRGAR
jgi:hypothetical protein